ncbi:MAG: ZIP family metal transporter [Candidatus Krumholzibacteria bacterium]
MSTEQSTQLKERGGAKLVVLAILPLLVLGLIAFGIIRYSGRMSLMEVPDVEELSIQWTTLEPGLIRLDVVNDGPDPVTIAQVMVDEAYWQFEIVPAGGTLAPRQKGVITLPYPWVEGETHEVVLVSRNGVTFDTEIAVALESPKPSLGSLRFFVLLGIIIGVVPVGLGIMWFPVVRHLSERWVRFLLAFTVGLLLFLGLDTVEEGLEIAERLPGFYQGNALLAGVAILIFLGLIGLGRMGPSGSGPSTGMMLAFMIALGIGLHNVGEGLAVGSAYVLGEVAVGTTLVLGFTLHNITEGLAIIVPLARRGLRIWHLVGLGALAGIPTIAGTLIGGFTYSTLWALVFFAFAAGAIFQVVYVIARSRDIRSASGEVALPENFLGLALGLAVMYATGLLVVA